MKKTLVALAAMTAMCDAVRYRGYWFGLQLY